MPSIAMRQPKAERVDLELSYDANQALEGAAGSAGRTESTSTSN
jgi:hypothetical protein